MRLKVLIDPSRRAETLTMEEFARISIPFGRSNNMKVKNFCRVLAKDKGWRIQGARQVPCGISKKVQKLNDGKLHVESSF